MRVYFSGISGTGLGPLALMAKDAGFDVVGSDIAEGAILTELRDHDITVDISEQNGDFIKKQKEIDWFVYTSALPDDHPELVWARKNAKKVSKRDEFTNYLIKKLKLKLVAVAGTHGKTTTTSILIWIALKMKLPVSYISGTTLGFAPSGAYHKKDRYFIYEADEYDRNFLSFKPWLSLIPYISYDHPDIYPTKQNYEEAFLEFAKQSNSVIFSNFPDVDKYLKHDKTRELIAKMGFSPNSGRFATVDGRISSLIKLAGEARREDAALAIMGITDIMIDINSQTEEVFVLDDVFKAANEFPGVGRRFEKIADGFYTDYAHHPEEIKAALETAKEEVKRLKKKGVVCIYEPHQNTRQHEIRFEYHNAFRNADKIFWLPTYLTREDPDLDIIEPETFVRSLKNRKNAEVAELSDEFAKRLKDYRDDGYLVILLSAGPADKWFREKFSSII